MRLQKSPSPTKRAARARISKPGPSPRVRRDPTQTRSRQTVDAIVEAAGQLLVERGRQAVTTNAVAERAGASIGSVYQYFPNKESIFEALQERHRDQVMPLIQHTIARLGDASVDIAAAIVGLVRAMAELHASDPARLRAIADELHEQTSADEIDSFTEATTRILASRLRCPESAIRPAAWLACVTVSLVGRTLVHHPPALDVEPLLDALERMLRGLFSDFSELSA